MSLEKKLFIFTLVGKLILLAGVIFFLGEGILIWSDSNTYIDIGRNIYKGNGFSESLIGGGYEINTIRVPLYPAFIGFFDSFSPHGLVIVSVFQAIAASFISVLIYRVGILFLPSKWSIFAAVLLSFEPLISTFHMLIMPETFLVMFIMLFSLYFMRHLQNGDKKNLIISGIFLAFSMYTKPVVLYLVVVPVVFLIVKKSYAKLVIFLSIILIIMMPWMVRNKLVADVFDISTDDTGNICSWELSGIMASKYRVDSTNWNNVIYLPEYIDVRERCTSTMSAIKIFITEYPVEFFTTSLLSTASLLTNEGYTALFEKPPEQQIKIHHNYLTPAVLTNSDWADKISGALKELSFVEISLVILGKIFWLTLSIFALIGMNALILKKKSLLAAFVASLMLYFVLVTVISTGLGVGARLRYPIDAFIVVLGLSGIYYLVWPKLRIWFKRQEI